MSPSALFVTTVPVTLEAFLLPFAERFREAGWRVDALANGASSDPFLKDAFDERFDVAWSRNPLDPRNLRGTASRVRDIVVSGRYDIVHVHTPIAAFVTRFALRGLRARTRTRLIYTAHGFHFYRGQAPLPHALFHAMERAAAPWTDYLVTVNREDYDAARALGGIDPERVRYIPGIGVDTTLFSPRAATPDCVADLRRGLKVRSDALMIAMVAEFAPVKRHAFALDALALVKDPRVVVVFVGAGPLEGRVRQRAAKLGLLDRVRFAGYRRDVAALLVASDAAMLVSDREGLNRSVLEAMACGRPVFGTDTRGIADAIGPECGWVVAKDSPVALAAAIDAAAADPAGVAQRGDAARRRVCTHFALGPVIEAYEDLYREALASQL